MTKATIAAAATLMVLAGRAHAIPIELDATQFAAQVAGTTVTVEDFEGIATGLQSIPFVFSNASFTSNFPTLIDGFILPTRQLMNNAPDPVTGRVFDAFAAGTTAFGLDIGGIHNDDVLTMTVVGASGTLSLSQTIGSLGGFVGFFDAAGLVSVTFHNSGHSIGEGIIAIGNYAFDNVRTAATAVPEPFTLSLLSVGLLALGLTRRRARPS